MKIRIGNLKIYIPHSSPIYTIIEVSRIIIPAIIFGVGFLGFLWFLG